VCTVVEPQSLLTMWTSRINAIHRDRCREFSGRLEAGPGNKAELYQHMKDDGSVAAPSVYAQSYAAGCSVLFNLVFFFRGVYSASEMTCIVSGAALNSHPLWRAPLRVVVS